MGAVGIATIGGAPVGGAGVGFAIASPPGGGGAASGGAAGKGAVSSIGRCINRSLRVIREKIQRNQWSCSWSSYVRTRNLLTGYITAVNL